LDTTWSAGGKSNHYMSGELPTGVRHLIRNQDAKFTRSFDDVSASEGARVILPPIRAPKANAFAERFVRTAREELLDRTLVLGPRHLYRLLPGTSSTTTPTDRIEGSDSRLRMLVRRTRRLQLPSGSGAEKHSRASTSTSRRDVMAFFVITRSPNEASECSICRTSSGDTRSDGGFRTEDLKIPHHRGPPISSAVTGWRTVEDTMKYGELNLTIAPSTRS
jgi:hypothetical protein